MTGRVELSSGTERSSSIGSFTMTIMQSTPVAPSPSASHAGKFLTFALGNEEFGIEILRVREIIKLMEITAVPHMPAYVRGVINLRGQVIAVADLRSAFGMPTAPATDCTCIIVVELRSDAGRLNMGLVVDRVSEVCNIRAESIDEAPVFGSAVKPECILGMGKIGSGVKLLLDIDRVFPATLRAAFAPFAE